METEKKPIAPASKNAILEMLAKTDSSGQNFMRHISLNKKSMINLNSDFYRRWETNWRKI